MFLVGRFFFWSVGRVLGRSVRRVFEWLVGGIFLAYGRWSFRATGWSCFWLVDRSCFWSSSLTSPFHVPAWAQSTQEWIRVAVPLCRHPTKWKRLKWPPGENILTWMWSSSCRTLPFLLRLFPPADPETIFSLSPILLKKSINNSWKLDVICESSLWVRGAAVNGRSTSVFCSISRRCVIARSDMCSLQITGVAESVTEADSSNSLALMSPSQRHVCLGFPLRGSGPSHHLQLPPRKGFQMVWLRETGLWIISFTAFHWSHPRSAASHCWIMQTRIGL